MFMRGNTIIKSHGCLKGFIGVPKHAFSTLLGVNLIRDPDQSRFPIYRL